MDDTGASISCVNTNIFNNEQFLEKIISIQTAGGQIKASKFVQVPLFYPYNKTKMSFIVSPHKLPFTGIIGTDIINKLQIHLDLPNALLVVPGVTYEIITISSRGSNNITMNDERMTSIENTEQLKRHREQYNKATNEQNEVESVNLKKIID